MSIRDIVLGTASEVLEDHLEETVTNTYQEELIEEIFSRQLSCSSDLTGEQKDFLNESLLQNEDIEAFLVSQVKSIVREVIDEI